MSTQTYLSRVPATRPLQFTTTEYRGEEVWMVGSGKAHKALVRVEEFTRYQINEEVFVLKDLELIYNVALEQGEHSEVLDWTQEAIKRAKNKNRITQYPVYFTAERTSLVLVQHARDSMVYIKRPKGMHDMITNKLPKEELAELKEYFSDRSKYPAILVDAIKEAVK